MPGGRVCSQSVIIPPVTQCGHTKHSGDWGNKACDFSWTPQRLLGNLRHLVWDLVSVTYDCVLTYPPSSVLSRFSSASLHNYLAVIIPFRLMGLGNRLVKVGEKRRLCHVWTCLCKCVWRMKAAIVPACSLTCPPVDRRHLEQRSKCMCCWRGRL